MSFVRSLALSIIPFLLFHSLFTSTIFINCFHFAQPSQCHEDESHALLQFKEGFVISNFASFDPLSYPKTSSWNASSNCCSWEGIECDESTGHVIGIDVSSSQLYGSMDANSSLFSLVHLQSLNLAYNDFNYSQIPSKIGELSHMRYLNLSNSVFSGEIPPQVSQLSKLLSLDLGRNMQSRPDGINLLQLKPSILKSIIKNSTKLEVLLLSYVTISSPVPDILANLTSLQTLSFYNCDMYGEFPVGIFHLRNLSFLNLRHNQNLTGKLPDFQSNSLRTLSIDYTSFYGTIPASIGNLSSLTTLVIQGSNFFGSLPSSLGNLTQLTGLDLSWNNFTVETFSWIGKLSSISFLRVSSLNIGSEIPLSFANLTQLQHLSAYKCNLTGEIPSWIANLTKLAFLDLDRNNLRGEIPNSFFTLENLEILDLHNNLLHGKLELDMFLKFKKLTCLDLGSNNLSLLNGKSSSNWSNSRILVLGLDSCNLVEFPTFIRYLGELGSLYLSYNSITSVPSWLWTKTTLLVLNVEHSSLTGVISPSICNLKSLRHLDLSFNNLSGGAPSCLGSFSQSLKLLVLRGNKLSGQIPHTYLIGNTLQKIDFSNNNLQGQLPRELVNCGRLEYFDVSHNYINDSFPFWLGDSPELKVLGLRGNQFHGAIRCLGNMTCKFPKLHIIDLSHNQFSGSFPSEMIQRWESMKASNTSQLLYEEEQTIIWDPSGVYIAENTYAITMSNKGVEMVYPNLQKVYYLIAIDISNNKISGEIPKVIGDLTRLVFLNLSNNLLTGSIPSSLGKLSNLEALDLSLNSLSGEIPQQLTALTFLEFFNISFNKLSGPIPQNNQFSTFQANSFEGNPGLCGDQLLKKCAGRPSLDPQPSASDVDEDSDSFMELDWKIVLIGYAGGLVAGVALGCTFSPEIFRWLKRIF